MPLSLVRVGRVMKLLLLNSGGGIMCFEMALRLLPWSFRFLDDARNNNFAAGPHSHCGFS